jgi:hypothetical protein
MEDFVWKAEDQRIRGVIHRRVRIFMKVQEIHGPIDGPNSNF